VTSGSHGLPARVVRLRRTNAGCEPALRSARQEHRFRIRNMRHLFEVQAAGGGHRNQFAPKGQEMTAQGNALGAEAPPPSKP